MQTILISRGLATKGIYLDVDLLDSTSAMFQLWTIGKKLYKIA
jgi:F0F1-type ATP synthase beta subunit